MKNIKRISVGLSSSIKKTIRTIERGGAGIALVVDKKQRFIGTITDGDIRRAILKNIPLETKINKLIKDYSLHRERPITVCVGTPHEKILRMMKEKVLRHIPVLDEKGRVKELVWISELIKEELNVPVSAIVMAGGKGERLHPLTKNTPKPMLLLKNRPLMEHTIKQLSKFGIKKVRIATNYKSEAIANHFGNGSEFGVDINYINEKRPLGTAGALGSMKMPSGTTLVLNGDILTQLDFRAMFDFHRHHMAIMTVGVRKCDFKVPYGVIETDDVEIANLLEKPIQTFLVNAGVYLIEPVAYRYIPKQQNFDMTDLVERLLKEKLRVISFPIQEYWLDIGHPIDYKKATEDAKNGKI